MDLSGTATTADLPVGPELHTGHKAWLEKRGIPSDLAEKMGITTRQDDRGNWLVIPYRLDGKLVNRKYRLTKDKLHEMDKGGRLCLWNAEALRSPHVETGASVIITEGEFDALIAMHCGFSATVSVPNGAPAKAVDDPVNSNRYAFMWESQSDLEKVAKFVIATDADEPGMLLARDLAAILGPERCSFLSYPEGCKDLNEVFLKHGAYGVNALITEAKPFPVKGVYRLSDFPECPPVRGMATGIDALDGNLELCMGTFNVLTGYANMGKTTVMYTMLAHAIAKGVPVAVANLEGRPRSMARSIAKAMLGCADTEYDRHPDRDKALAAIDNHMSIITNALDEDLEFDLETFLETLKTPILRDGAKIIVLDPWNELEHKRKREESLTEYVGRAIRKIKAFAARYDVCFWVIAHPTKPQKGSNDVPSLYDISDSANWANKADYGLVYHLHDKTVNEAKLVVVKVKEWLPGRRESFDVYLDHRTSRIRQIQTQSSGTRGGK